MEILFLGYAVAPEENRKLSGKSEAGNKMELSILYQLKKRVDELNVITVYPLAPFPLDKNLVVKYKRIGLGNGIKSQRVSFINVPIIKQITQMISVYQASSKIVKNKEHTIVVAFNMYPQVGVPAILLKRKYNCRIIPFLADLPIDDNYQRKGISRIVHNIFYHITKKSILDVKEVVVLNKHARDIFAPKSRYLVIDGGYDPTLYPELQGNSFSKEDDGIKHLVYTGSLAEYSGIMNLISAMKMVKNKNIVLDIYGSGNLQKYMESLNMQNVKYHGMADNKKIISIQRNSWLLVNPRPVEDEIAKVTFPSKIFEYMLSGTPVLTTRLNGFSDEYKDKIFFAEDNRPETLAFWINYIDTLSKEYLVQIADMAKTFIENKKTWEIQIKRLIKFLEDGETGEGG